MLRAEKEDEAFLSYKQALKYDKKQYPIWNQVLIMEYQESKFEELYQDSKECLEYFPSIATIYLLNGVGAVQTKRYEDAIAILDAGKDLVVNDKAIEAEMYGQLGEAYFYQKKNDLGKEMYEKALVLDPASFLLRNNYAYRLALAKIDLNHALELIESVVGTNETAHFLDTKGVILFQQGKYAEAMIFYEKAYKSEPSDKIIVEHMGDAYFKAGNKDKAFEFWKRAKELGATNMNLDKKIEKKEYYDPNY
jgi:tetratricopeptide (TPR) repeat protein